ncbi:unnamed protein product [Camellia sinensis]
MTTRREGGGAMPTAVQWMDCDVSQQHKETEFSPTGASVHSNKINVSDGKYNVINLYLPKTVGGGSQAEPMKNLIQQISEKMTVVKKSKEVASSRSWMKS